MVASSAVHQNAHKEETRDLTGEALHFVGYTGHTHVVGPGQMLYWSGYCQQWMTWEAIWVAYSRCGKQ